MIRSLPTDILSFSNPIQQSATVKYHTLNMNFTNALVHAASSSRCGVYAMAAKVACYTIFPFLLIAAFEAVLLNSARMFANTITALASAASWPCATPETSSKSYACTASQKEAIYEIVETVANNAKFDLLWSKKTRLGELEAAIQSVHPLKFLSIIIADPQRKDDLRLIFADPFKRIGFMNGLSPNLAKECQNNRLFPHLGTFSKEVHLSAETIRPFFETRNWEQLVWRLLRG